MKTTFTLFLLLLFIASLSAQNDKVGIGISNPEETLDVDGAIKINDTNNSNPTAGTIRWNPASNDFEGYTGSSWQSLTSTGDKFWGNNNIMYNSTENIKVTANDAAANDYFGCSVANSGDYLLVGAYGDEVTGQPESGTAYIFIQTGDSWTELPKLFASDAAGNDRFGISVAIDGNYTIIGADQDIHTAGNAGSAYIFHLSGGVWSQQAKLTASDAAAHDNFGNSVSISADYAVIGALSDDSGSGANSGSAYIFKRTGTSWNQEAKLTASDASTQDYFGRSVSISGDYVIVGADFDDDGGVNSGSAYLFEKPGGGWADMTENTKITASDAAFNDYFGRSVSISGDQAIVGAYGNDDDGSESGSAYIFKRTAGVWTEQTKLTATDAAANDNFGFNLSIAGDDAIIGAFKDDGKGSAYIFHRTGTAWTQQVKLTASEGAASDDFGRAVSIADGIALSGAYHHDEGGSNAGTVYIFH